MKIFVDWHAETKLCECLDERIIAQPIEDMAHAHRFQHAMSLHALKLPEDVHVSLEALQDLNALQVASTEKDRQAEWPAHEVHEPTCSCNAARRGEPPSPQRQVIFQMDGGLINTIATATCWQTEAHAFQCSR